MMKSRRNPQLDKDLIKFLVKSVQRKPQSSTLDSLLKYTMRLDDKVCNYMGHTKEDLKTFLSMFSNELYVDDSEKVFLIGKDGHPQFGENKNVSPEKGDKIDRTLADKPISQATGSIYRILGKYGFIELHPPHVGKVYFDGRHVEDGRHMFLIDYGYKEGMKVQIDAIPGPENAEASYRAKHVRRLSSELSANDSNIVKSETINMVDKVGKIAQVFDQYGFISRTSNKVDDVFFFMNTIVMPEGKQISSPLTDVLSPGMEAKFDARPNHRQDAQNSWYATRVWIKGVSDKGDAASKEFTSANGPLDSLDDLNEKDVYISDDEDCNGYDINELPSIITNESGHLSPLDDYKGIITFGKNKYKALYISDVVRVDGRKVEDQAWRFEGGHDVNFHAQVIDIEEFCVMEKNIIATLVWIGKEPDNIDIPLNDLHLLYAERHKLNLHYNNNNHVTELTTNDKKSTQEMDLLDEFIAGKFPKSYGNDTLDSYSLQSGMNNGYMLQNEMEDQWNSYDINQGNKISNSILPPLPPSPGLGVHHSSYPYEFSGWNSLFNPCPDQMKTWKNSSIGEGIVSGLNYIDTSSQTVPHSKVSNLSATCQTPKPVQDSPQTMKMQSNDQLSSSAEFCTKNVSTQTEEGLKTKSSSHACQTDFSFGKIKPANEWISGEEGNQTLDKEILVQLCPKCHLIYHK